jgi:predicted MFS family arabinose efflux permease
MAAGSLAGSAANLTLPLWLGAAVETLGAPARDVAWVASLELGCLALAALGLAPRLGEASRHSLALAGVLLLALGNAAAALAPSLTLLFLARALAGAGAGAIMAATNATAAATSVPERTYALMFVLGGAGCALVMWLMPRFSEPHGMAGAFAVLLVTTLCVAPLLLWMPAHPAAARDADPGPFPRGPAVVAGLLASLVVMVGVDALWAFGERIGRRAGLEAASIGLVLALASLVVLAAGALASWLGTRAGRIGPLSLGFLICVPAAVALGHAGSPGAWVPAVLLLAAGFFFAQPFMMGTLAALDRHGRVVAAAGAAMTVGAALGPGVGGVLAAGGSYARLGWFGGACAVFCWALVAGVALHVGRRAAPAGARP